jgi:hypothetical protein
MVHIQFKIIKIILTHLFYDSINLTFIVLYYSELVVNDHILELFFSYTHIYFREPIYWKLFYLFRFFSLFLFVASQSDYSWSIPTFFSSVMSRVLRENANKIKIHRLLYLLTIISCCRYDNLVLHFILFSLTIYFVGGYSVNMIALIYLCMYVCIYGSTVLLLDLGRFFSFFIHTQSVGLLGRGISPSQGRYLHTGQQKHRINAYGHPCLKWDSNPRSQCLSGRKQFIL